MSVILERRGGTAIITINRPEARNAIDPATSRALSTTFDEVEDDSSIAAVVLTGAGDRAFSAGMDVMAYLSGAPVEDFVTAGGFGGITRRCFPKPLIAAVNGHALGGGFELVLACDLVVAVDGAMFGMPEVKVGHLADEGALVRLAKRIPLAIALEMALTGEPISARRAHQLGLVNRVVVRDRLLEAACELAEKVIRNSPPAVRLSKLVMQASLCESEPAAWQFNEEARKEVMSGPDPVEGARALIERRPPTWRVP